MRTLALVAGILLIFTVLFDAFQTIILPRRATGRFRLTRLFYISTWKPWTFFARRLHHPRKRETLLGYYGPLSLILLLVVWAAAMVLGFALIYYAIGSPFNDPAQPSNFHTDLYVSGTTLFTLGLGDVTPHSPLARFLLILECGTGFGFLAVVMGYFPVLYAAFSRREVNIALLDARAGSPPSAAELMRRHSYDGAAQAALRSPHRMGTLVRRAPRKPHLLSAALLLPLPAQQPKLAQRSHRHPRHIIAAHRRRSRSGSSPGPAHLRHGSPRARRPLADLQSPPHHQRTRWRRFRRRRLTAFRPNVASELYDMLTASGIELCYNEASRDRLRQMRALYEGHAEALSRFLLMPLPEWFYAQPRKDNWQTVARLRAQTEAPGAANPDPVNPSTPFASTPVPPTVRFLHRRPRPHGN